MQREHIHFVTGRLAEFSLRKLLDELAPACGFDYTVDVLGITVAALMTTEWVAPRIDPPPRTTRVLLPGYCLGDLEVVAKSVSAPVERGPRDLHELPEYFGRARQAQPHADAHDIEILAEINHAPRLPREQLLAEAARLAAAGADLIDLGCTPGETWTDVGAAVRELVAAGRRVSIDSFNLVEVEAAVRAGAELVLSVNAGNRQAARDWGCEVVVVPDSPGSLAGLDETVAYLAEAGVPLRIDPVLEPIGFGFAASLGRYIEVRRRYPDAEMMMGVGNLTELTDADSAAINVLLLGFCQELGVRSVLTTEVINWARTSVAECDLARRLVYRAVRERTLPKHVEPRLVTLRDAKLTQFGGEALDRLAGEIKDHNLRLFAEGDALHLISAGVHLTATDPFHLFEQLVAQRSKPLDASHAFYLGYELSKALTALTLGKQYRQDEALDWGFLTRPETSHRARRAKPDAPPAEEPEQ